MFTDGLENASRQWTRAVGEYRGAEYGERLRRRKEFFAGKKEAAEDHRGGRQVEDHLRPSTLGEENGSESDRG